MDASNASGTHVYTYMITWLGESVNTHQWFYQGVCNGQTHVLQTAQLGCLLATKCTFVLLWVVLCAVTLDPKNSDKD